MKTPLMAAVTAQRQDWLADEAVADPSLKTFKDEQWRDVLDALIERIKAKTQPQSRRKHSTARPQHPRN
jgi:hypothetical protein